MTKDLLWRGMLVGVLAALLSTLFARTFAEPHVDRAIAFEAMHAAHDPGHHADEGPELVSRDTQKGAGLLTAMALYGAAVGGIFALVFAYGYGRWALIGPRSFALLLAAGAFLLIVIVPALKYPPTPPAVGQHETVGLRTAAYFGLIALSIAMAVLAMKIRRVAWEYMDPFNASLCGAAAFIVGIALSQLALPVIDEVPADFPASLLWAFRIASLGTQAVLWAAIGLGFGALADRIIRAQSHGSPTKS
ncbi:CbtA family protein [Novosphingobium sp. G106]|uniref:CbtA family protein n=1 Tax=Novosphingobium sp. G106 TaxID=2849500 RepID=UPI001C2D1F42|nr:CbtA family protein [Novosphingobium sp. G106]MBV1687467.1 CbtA family protein [Novosphingobium sp. G106]